MLVAGVMSGTSADGINVALVREGEHGSDSPGGGAMRPAKRGHGRPRHIELVGHAEYPYSKKVRAAVLAAMNASQASVAVLARLNFLLGEVYAQAVLNTQRRFRVKVDLVGCHGQTIYHQGQPKAFLGRKLAATWQTGEGGIIAQRVGVPVVSDFRPADMAAGGKGAPLVPFLDYLLFRDPQVGRIVQNIGGIANLTSIPAGARGEDVTAFDTGPGNMVIDGVTEALFGQPFDRGGRIADSGNALSRVIENILRRRFFRRTPPKTAGREEFGRDFVSYLLKHCEGARKQDIVATATALTAKSIALAVQQWVVCSARSKTKRPGWEMILSGGGARNTTLVAMLRAELDALGVRLRFSDEFGVPSPAKEAVAFAMLAYETWHRRPSNLPSATGAAREAVLGKISYP